jgi:feruloyl esterase
VGGAPGLILAADQVALELDDPSLGSDMLKNATGNGNNRWAEVLDYEGLAKAQVEGVRRQAEFADINTDSPDLGQFKASGGKVILYQGLADEYIPPQGAVDYYEKTQAAMDGPESVTSFFRFYLIPGFTHSGRSEGPVGVPTPQPASGRDEMFGALQAWVEGKQTPGSIVVQSSDQKTSMPLCVYPSKAIINTGSVRSASSYACK